MLRKWIASLGQKRTPMAPIAPEVPFVALGDIHGRADLLDRFLSAAPDVQIVCVGDYVDRGDHSADVLRLLQDRPDILCLSGNHEEMMLRFIDAPNRNGARWLRYGGLQTLASFGVAGVSETSDAGTMTQARDALVAAMGDAGLHWLRNLHTRWTTGNVAVVHAGADPAIAIADQTRDTLHWGHAGFAKTRRADGMWVVHGHTIVDEAHSENGRIAIDTGAYATGRLTAVHVENSSVSFEIIT